MGELFKKTAKGYLIGTILFFLIICIFAVALRFTSLPGKWEFGYFIIALSLSCFFAAIYPAHFLGKRGLLYGSLFSVVFMIGILAMIHAFFFKTISPESFKWQYVIPLAFGSMGGIIGTNAKKT